MEKVEVQNYKSSINECHLSTDEIALIWEFYVTKSIAKSAEQKRSAADYGWKQLPYKKMMESAGIEEKNVKVLCANSINTTLLNMDLQIVEGTGDKKKNKPIDIDLCRIVCLTPYTISDEEQPKPKFGEIESILTHIRNSFAHGLTYFFDNGNVLFEDKEKSGTISARMILKQQTLIDWIRIIDYEHRYYGQTEENETSQNVEKDA